MPKCKFETTDIKVNSWGNSPQPYCKKHDQFLSGLTCDRCPDYSEKDYWSLFLVIVLIIGFFFILPPLVSGCIGYFDREQDITMGDF